MKVSVVAGVLLCAFLSLTLFGIALSISASQPADHNVAPVAADVDRFTRPSDTVVGNETPFKPEW
jgi:hypothetical protein